MMTMSTRWGEARAVSTPPWTTTQDILLQQSPSFLPLVASPSLEQSALDELREDRNDQHLHVPLLAVPGMHGHVLQRERELDGQPPQLHHLAHAHADGHRPDVPGRRLPVRQDIARVEDVPALAEEERRDGLQIELARIGPIAVAADREPLLGEHAEEEFLREVARHHSRPGLHLALAGEL